MFKKTAHKNPTLAEVQRGMDENRAAQKKGMSEAKLAANRENAKRSTGPKTASGKSRSSQNATKHGLLSESNPLNSPLGANHAISPSDYTTTLQAYTRDLSPSNTFETHLVARLAHLHLRLQRAAQMEEALLEREFYKATDWATSHPDALPTPDSPGHTTHILAETYDRSAKALNLLTHYEARLSRDFARTLRQLNESKAADNTYPRAQRTHPEKSASQPRPPSPATAPTKSGQTNPPPPEPVLHQPLEPVPAPGFPPNGELH